MPVSDQAADNAVIVSRSGLDELIAVLVAQGRRVVGPRLGDGAVVYDRIASTADLPVGIGDRREGGSYRLTQRSDERLFGYSAAPQGWKRVLYPPRQKLFSARRDGQGFTLDAPPSDQPLAIIGARACELAAIAIQAKVFGDPSFTDPGYQGRLSSAFIVAVECAEAGDDCFCASMGTGPGVGEGCDLRLVELPDQRFLATAHGKAGRAMLKKITTSPAGEADLATARSQADAVCGAMGHVMDAEFAATLIDHCEHPQWDDVATRCMACGNCTMVCPTCFCTTVEDITDLTGDHAERWRVWDSCFSVEFSHVAGGALRTSGRARYRQWITHKLSTWHGQFGGAGCVGCGRCITWCPVGIDITAEVKAIKNTKREGHHGSG